ncbi:MAG: dienelactone hydrolase family protein [Bacteroidetes bacterium]|nr:dienelactone hydrolase family protein [Bacteroidota bacterium]
MLTALRHIPDHPRAPRTALIMLHGRGADEHDLFGLRQYLDPQLEIHSLRAPFEYEWGGYAWFDLFEDGTVDMDGFRSSQEAILSYIRGVDAERLFLLGFSMGAIMSYAVALTQPGLCRGIAALSGFAPQQLEPDYRLQEIGNLHIFISHGIHDPVIPVAEARRTHSLFDASNAQVTYREYPMAHQIDQQCLADLGAWLQQRL